MSYKKNLSIRRAALSPAKQALLEKRLQGRATNLSEACAIPRHEGESPAPLSFAQERIWFQEQLASGYPLYNRPVCARLNGPLEADALRRSLNEIVRRHKALRTRFPVADGPPSQEVAPNLELILPLTDLRSHSESKRREAAMQLAIEEVRRVFDLANGPLVRAVLLRLCDREHWLVLTTHHIVFDGWSETVLLRELATFYETFSTNKPSPLASLPIQYADFSHWQRGQLQGKNIEPHLSYWRQQLKECPPALELMTDRPRPEVQTFRRARVNIFLPATLNETLKKLSQREGATLFMTLLAAFQTLLQRYTGQNDILVGTPIAGRNQVETEELIGVFINTLVMRSDLSGDPTFLELLARVKETALGAYTHQELPFEKLVEELQPERNLSRNPIVQVLFQLRNLGLNKMEAGNLIFEPFQLDWGTAHFDLNLDVVEKEDGLLCRFQYNSDLFEPATIERVAGHFHILLEGIAAEPSQPISKLPLLTDAEQQQLLLEFNDTQAPYPRDKCIHELFEEQVERTPEAVALVFGEEELTYGELNERANQLAWKLRADYEVGPDRIVGLLVERSIEMIVGILGTLKAGGAYMPIDREYPRERIEYMLEDSGCEVLLTQESLMGAMSFSGDTIDLEKREMLQRRSGGNLPSGGSSTDLAYVIYTSGSTGMPKGVLIEHRQLMQYVEGILERIGLEEGARYALLTSFATDLGHTAVYGSLCSGGALHIIDQELARDVERLAEYFVKEPMDCLKITPTHLNTLMECGYAGSILPRKRLVFGGERLGWEVVEKVWNVGGICDVYNHYGPTEATVGAICGKVPNGKEVKYGSSVPLGKPLKHSRIYIVDEHMDLQPLGIRGEICIGGAGVARGYCRNETQTQEVFIENPHVPGERIYRTGDLGRWLPDGNIEFLGRIDEQVKIRGFRVELGEVESVLMGVDEIKEAVVLAKERNGDKALVAYYVGDGEIEVGDIRERMGRTLPDYMVPSYYMELEEIPLTANGKVNLKVLPEPDGSLSATDVYVAPRDKVEQALAGIWKGVLGVERVGLLDNFFDLGGHSLKALNVVSRVKRELEIDLSLQELFETPTVRELALRLSTREHSVYAQLKEAESCEYYPVSSQQRRLYVLEQLEPLGKVYNIPMAGVLDKEVDLGRLQGAFEAVIERHEGLRTRFELIDGELVQRVHEEVAFQMECEVLAAEDVEAQMAAFMEPFDLNEAPLLRVKVLCQVGGEKILLMYIHHIVSDGTSLRILFRDLGRAYGGEPLKKLPLQYRDYAVWQQEGAGRELLERQGEYWLKQYEEPVPVLNLPTDFERRSERSFEGATIGFTMSQKVRNEIQAYCKRTEATLYMVLLASMKVLLSRYSGQDDIVLGSLVIGREHPELNEVIGMFVNTLAIRSRPEGAKRFSDYLAEVKSLCLEGFENQQYPFEELVNRLELDRDPSRNPLFDVMVAVQNLDPEPDTADIGIIWPYEIKRRTAKFDLTLTAWEGENELAYNIEYATGLYKKETIRRFASHLERVIEEVVGNSTIRISEIEILSDTEKDQLLHEFNDTAVEYPKDKCIHELFEEQVEQTPEAIALVFGEEELSYGELNARANQLAWKLREDHRVGPDRIVGLLVNRSVEMIVGILGILKAGGAYMPIDPEYPRERIEYMLEDSGCNLLLTQGSFLGAMSFSGDTIDLEKREMLQRRSGGNLLSRGSSSDLAYVIYTSGSTGKPKGVLVEHRNVVRLVKSPNYIEFSSDDRLLLSGAQVFDATTFEYWAPLLNGFSLYMLEDKAFLDLDRLGHTIRENRITLMWLTAPLFNQIVDYDVSLLKGLEQLLVGGDTLSPRHINTLRHEVPGIKIVNGYGPTENTTFTACYRIEQDFDERIPIGRPINNGSVYILDNAGKLVPIGVLGELCVSGAGLARGYLNRDELTAEKFVENPFATGERMYRTGDLARWLPDGNIEFWGRVDNQVKIRGFRVELGEVESVLREIDGIKEAVVLAKERNGEKTLVAYYVGNGEIETSEIRERMGRTLPGYMVPTHYIELPEIPLMTNGKVDRQGLPEPEGSPSTADEYVAPRNEVERKLVHIWESILDVRPIGIKDNFFDLGGHSLQSIILFHKIEKELGQRCEMAELFKAPTVEQLADVLRKGKSTDGNASFIPIEGGGNGPPLFLLHFLLHYRDLLPHIEDQPFCVVNLPIFNDAREDIDDPQDKIPHLKLETLAARYVETIQQKQPAGPYHLAGYSFGGLLAYEIAQQLEQKGEEVALVVLFDTGLFHLQKFHFLRWSQYYFHGLRQLGPKYIPGAIERRIKRYKKSLTWRLKRIVHRRNNESSIDTPEELKRQMFRRISQSAKGYQLSPYKGRGRIVLFRATESHSLRLRGMRTVHPVYGWEKLIAEKLEICDVPGGHHSLLQEPHVREVASKLKSYLAETRRDTT